MWKTSSKVALFVAVMIIFALSLGLSISKSNAKVLAISVVEESGDLYMENNIMVFSPDNKSKAIDDRTAKALKYLGRGYDSVVIE